MNTNVVRSFIAELGREIGIPDLELDEYGYCCFMLGEHVVNIETDDNGIIFLYSNIGDLPEKGREAFYEMLLNANYFCQQTAGGTLGVDSQADIVLYMMQAHESSLDGTAFLQMLENFINTAVTWSERIKDFSSEASGSSGKDRERLEPGTEFQGDIFA